MVERPDTHADRYGVIGWPVRHSLSPRIHARFAEQTGQRMRYEAIAARAEDFPTVVRRFVTEGGRGLNVTLPHKQAAWRLADALGLEAREAEAVNTLTFTAAGHVRGDNTDGTGLLRDIKVNLGFPLGGRRILVVGAGGAARGILGPLLREAPTELRLVNRTRARALALAEHFRGQGPVRAGGLEDSAGGEWDLVLNATSASLSGQVAPLPAAAVAGARLCYDLAYGDSLTAFERWAREAGARRTAQGLGMLVEQAAESFHIWRGLRPETAAVLADLREARGREN